MQQQALPVMPSRSLSSTWPRNRVLRGVIVPLVTPLAGRDELDVAGLERLIEHVLNGGVHGIFLLGTTGEAAALSSSLQREVVTRVCRLVRGRVPVLAGISDTALMRSLRLADDFARAGASAAVVTPPYYLPLDASELVSYVRTVSQESPLPVFLYNIPELTKTGFTLEVLTRAIDFNNVVGLKDSSGVAAHFERVQALASHRPDWSILIGTESLMAHAVLQGADGCVGGGANVWPQLLTSLYQASLVNDRQRIGVLQRQLVALGQLYQYGGYAVGCIRGIKCALSLLSITSDRMADPFLPVSDIQRRTISKWLRQWGLLSDAGANGDARAHFDEALLALSGVS